MIVTNMSETRNGQETLCVFDKEKVSLYFLVTSPMHNNITDVSRCILDKLPGEKTKKETNQNPSNNKPRDKASTSFGFQIFVPDLKSRRSTEPEKKKRWQEKAKQ